MSSTVDLRQWIKWVVYALLLVNFAFYIGDDWEIATHTRRQGGSFLDWTTSFATSIDELAWFVLLFLFELETYALSDEALNKRTTALLHGVRCLCYLFLAHTLYAYGLYIYDLNNVDLITGTSALCQLADSDLSFARNLEYTTIDAVNCSALSADSQFYFIEDETVLTDTEGLRVERVLATLDIVEACTWLAILFSIELSVRLQDRGITTGPVMRAVNMTKLVLYGLLWSAALYWATHDHLMFAWDEALWILGFAAIEMNVRDWREELRQAELAD